QLTPAVGTFPDYGTPVPDGDRIDWILTTPGVEVRAAAINTWTRYGRYPSDHTPVQALLRLRLRRRADAAARRVRRGDPDRADHQARAPAPAPHGVDGPTRSARSTR